MVYNSHDSGDDFRSSLLTTTVLFRTTQTQTITLDKLLILLGSNHTQSMYFTRTICEIFSTENR